MDRPTKEQVDGMLGVDVYDCDGSTAKAIAENLQAEVRALREKYHEPPPSGLTVRDAARQRYALSGPDAQALEGALQQAERERDLASAAHEAAELRIVELRAELADADERNQYLRETLESRGILGPNSYGAPLVKAARAVPENMEILRLSDSSREVADILYAIHKALEPFA